jgi:hypothetical protein
MSRGERPSKLNAERQERIVTALRAGNYFDESVRAAGVHPSTAYRWLEIAERTPALDCEEFAELPMEQQIIATANQPYRAFREAVLDAVAEAEVRDIQLIDRAAETDWRASAWKRERLAPARWGNVKKLQLDKEAIDELAKTMIKVVEEALAAAIPDVAIRQVALLDILNRLSALKAPAGDRESIEPRSAVPAKAALPPAARQ